MKKIIALVVAILMIASMSVVAFAATTIQGGQDNGNTTLLSYGVSEHYVVTIPESLDLGTSKDVNVSLAEGFAIGWGKTLAITVASTNGWVLLPDDKDAGNEATITYDIKQDGASVKTAPVLTAAADVASDAVAESFTVELGTIPSIVATYTDTLTFTVNPDYVAA